MRVGHDAIESFGTGLSVKGLNSIMTQPCTVTRHPLYVKWRESLLLLPPYENLGTFERQELHENKNVQVKAATAL